MNKTKVQIKHDYEWLTNADIFLMANISQKPIYWHADVKKKEE